MPCPTKYRVAKRLSWTRRCIDMEVQPGTPPWTFNAPFDDRGPILDALVSIICIAEIPSLRIAASDHRATGLPVVVCKDAAFPARTTRRRVSLCAPGA